MLGASIFGLTDAAAETIEDAVPADHGERKALTLRRRWRYRRAIPANGRKAQRQSQPGYVLDAVHGPASNLYTYTPSGKLDRSYANSQTNRVYQEIRRTERLPRRLPDSADQANLPISLYTIFARRLRNTTIAEWTGETFEWSQQELAFMEKRGYTEEDVRRWVTALVKPLSLRAAKDLFLPGRKTPPLFLVLLFLRRKRIHNFALGMLMRHMDSRLQFECITWKALKLLVVRLLRHARTQWPESIPWIASLFASEAARIAKENENRLLSPTVKSDLTYFCNAFLSLLALPTKLQPVLSTLYRQEAQFHVLRFMAEQSPALTVTRLGFRATMRVQLAHRKTEQEREWALLKGPSWPPWMHQRTAMDEGKDYGFSASRASRIMHRMFEAGYPDRKWEKIVQMYAGWDTDLSPTIQTRHIVTLPNNAAPIHAKYAEKLLWAARVRTTRTRREAWACFLAYEASGAPPSQQVYHAMFEKLYYPEVETHMQDVTGDAHTPAEPALLPGDMKEVLPEPKSPMDRIYIAEPVPSYDQLYHRMRERGVQPAHRFLAFLIETMQDFSMTLELLDLAKNDFQGGIQRLLDSSVFGKSAIEETPGYFFAAFIRFLCNHGRWAGPPPVEPIRPLQEEHAARFKVDRHYTLEYAYALLMHIRPGHLPAWTAYMQSVNRRRFHARNSVLHYKAMSALIDTIQQEDIQIDAEQLLIMCSSAERAARAALQGSLTQEDARPIFLAGPRQLRSLFHDLVSSHLDPEMHAAEVADTLNPIPPHIPGPAVLHKYVRALGTLHDYEGLYSFATWAKSNSAGITNRAAAQHSGLVLLRRALIALRAALEGHLHKRQSPAAEDLIELIKVQINDVEEWGGWPSDEEVEVYTNTKMR